PSAHLLENDVTVNERVEGNIQAQEAGSRGRQVAMVALACFGVYCLAGRSERRLKVQGLLGAAVLFFLGWCALSVAWSSVPLTTARRVAVLACLSLGALGCARVFSLRQILAFV